MAEVATKLPIRTEKPHAPARTDWSPFESLRHEIDRLFEDFRPFDWRTPLSHLNQPAVTKSAWSIAPAIDLVEKDKEFEITAELPGIDEKNIEVKVANQILTVRGEKKESKEEKEKDYYLSERRYGSFQRSFRLPETVDADKIEASFAKGVLTVNLPKTADAQKNAKTITVKAA
ncbi:MAG: Hsp20/alpha crystallin family protein [Parvibaculaceae bacterium]